MRVFDDNRRELDATFTIEPRDGRPTLVYESKGGSQGTRSARNLDYNKALELLLARLKKLSAVITDAAIETRDTAVLPIGERRLLMPEHGYPIKLSDVDDLPALRKSMSRAQAAVGRDPERHEGGGNPTKRIRVYLEAPGIQEAESLELRLAGRSNARRYWAFAANPKLYRIDEAVRKVNVDPWRVRNNDVRVGDGVIIWRTRGNDGHRGVVAFGEVTSPPRVRSERHVQFWTEAPEGEALRADVAYCFSPRLPLWLDEHRGSVLETLSVARATGGSIFHVTPEQWQAVHELAGGPPSFPSEEPSAADDEYVGLEGAARERMARHRKRDRELRKTKIRAALLAGDGSLCCEVPGCGFDFLAVYGELGREFAHVHHRSPLSERQDESVTRLSDLAIVCANCHAIIHRGGESRPLEGLISGRSTRT